MNMDDLPRRKQNRLENYDYSQCGLYFITICTNDKIEYFGTIAEPENPVGANCVRPCHRNGREYPDISTQTAAPYVHDTTAEPQNPVGANCVRPCHRNGREYPDISAQTAAPYVHDTSAEPQSPVGANCVRPYHRNGREYPDISTQTAAPYVRDTTAEPQSLVGANCVRPWSLVRLSEYGMMVKNEIQKINSIYDSVSIDKYIIMPNHIHMIIRIETGCDAADGRTQFAPTVSRLIKQFKGSITKQIGFSMWQKSFHDHIIRNQKEYREIWRYINNNPINWQYDELYIERR